MITFEGATPDAPDLRVVCEVEVGGLAKAVLHAHNIGSTAVYYEWKRLDKPLVFDVKVLRVRRLLFIANFVSTRAHQIQPNDSTFMTSWA